MKSFLKIIAIVSILAAPALAEIPGEEKEITPIQKPEEVPATGLFSAATMNKIMPKNLNENSNPEQVQKDIMNKGLDAIVKSDAVKRTGVAQAAETLENSVNTEMHVISDQGVEHKIKMKIIPLQAAARLDYSGLVNASATYKPAEEDVDLTITEKISENAQLQLTHQTAQSLSMVNFNFNW